VSPEAQRIAIAEACGWLSIKNHSTIRINGLWMGYPPKNAIINKPVELPDYLNDLNAIHEAISNQGWDANEMLSFLRNLKEIVAPHYLWENMLTNWCLSHATAAQRAEAFLKCLNLWI
jgi:hypothetical protein